MNRKRYGNGRSTVYLLKGSGLSIFLVLIGLLAAAPTAFGSKVLVAGRDSDNVVQFDLSTGKWSEVARLPEKSHPRGITIGDRGEIYLGLEGAGKNIVTLTSSNGVPVTRDVTHSIGRFGPGIIAFGKGEIWAAGDTARTIYRVDPETGQVSRPSRYKSHFNLVGLAADGETLYAAEYFQRSIMRYDLSAGDTNAITLIAHDPHLNRPIGMTIGHNGNLYVANALEPTVVEFDIKTGAYVRTLVDLGTVGAHGINGIVYAPEVRRYYLASGSDIYEVDLDGKVLASYNSPALKNAYGIALLPDDQAHSGGSEAFVSSAIPIASVKMTALGRLHVSGKAGEHYQVLATTDFINWQPIAVLDNSTGDTDFVDPDAGKFDKRFYRLEILPEKP